MSLPYSIYKHSPPAAQNVLVSAFGLYWHWLRFGNGYSASLKGYTERERFTAKEFEAWQAVRLRELLTIAIHEIPYYQRTWSASELSAARNGALKDLPLLEKESIRAFQADFISRKPVRAALSFPTSGTTGTPIKALYTISELRDSLAVREARSARWAGVSFSLPRATFSGRIVVPDSESRGPFHRFNLVERQAYLSAFHLRPDTAAQYIEAFRRHGIQWLTGYAVSYFLLAKFILQEKLRVPPLKAVVTTSEKLTQEMRVVMEAAYKCRVFEEYSTVENAVFASECEQGRLHVSPDVGILEILRSDGTPCDPGEVGEVVATCLMRMRQPFIRYRLGDLAAWDPERCPCGREMPVIKEIVGRIEDVVVGPDGRQMVRFHGIFADQPHVSEGQIIQQALDRIKVRVVPTVEFGDRDIKDIQSRIRQRLGQAVKVEVETVESIPRSKSGKFKAVVSHIAENPSLSAVKED